MYGGIQMFGNNRNNKLSIFFLSRNESRFTWSRICKKKSPVARGLQNIAFYTLNKHLVTEKFNLFLEVSFHLPEGTGNKQAKFSSNLGVSTGILF
jgi:hypothetical protein